MISMDAAMQKALLGIHNELRNEIALGKVNNYRPAANMATMKWDNDLANLCAYNVKQCNMAHNVDCIRKGILAFEKWHYFFRLKSGAN